MQPRFIGQLHHRLLAHRALLRPPVEVEDRGLRQRRHEPAGGVHRLRELRTGQALRLQSVAEVEVEEMGLALGHPTERIAAHPRELLQGILGAARLECGLEPPQHGDVLGGECPVGRTEARRPSHALDQGRIESEHGCGLGDRVPGLARPRHE